MKSLFNPFEEGKYPQNGRQIVVVDHCYRTRVTTVVWPDDYYIASYKNNKAFGWCYLADFLKSLGWTDEEILKGEPIQENEFD